MVSINVVVFVAVLHKLRCWKVRNIYLPSDNQLLRVVGTMMNATPKIIDN